MSDYSYFVDLIASGRTLGIGLGSTMRDVEEQYGGGYLDNSGDGFVQRDYGLVEFTFQEPIDWQCGSIMVQVHRLLSSGRDENVPPPVESVYGLLPERIVASKLLEAVAALGCVIERVHDEFSYETRFEIAATGCIVIVMNEVSELNIWPSAGEVWSISLNRVCK